MDNVLEQQRAAHEDIERLEQAIVDQFMQDPKTHRERLHNEHTVDKFLTRIAKKSERLHDLYKDSDGIRQSEIDALSGSSEFSEFYERLKVIKEHHRKYPNEPVDPPEMEFIYMSQKYDEKDEEELERLFSGEEGFGRYLDLNALHAMYVNLKGVKKLDYLQYLSEFHNFAKMVPKAIRNTEDYKIYLDKLAQYLASYFRRAKPLFDLKELEEKSSLAFDERWKEGKVEGWEDIANGNTDSNLFCAACQKQFAKQSVFDAHFKGKKHIKAQEKLDSNSVGQEDKRKQTAWKESLIQQYVEALADTREETKANVERKQALTDKERTLEQEQEEIEIAEQESDDEDDDKIYNPLKLPLGWDGKPIPYWLYKLHGLGVEYPCEICGNYVYMGRKAFDKHFQEWRHAHGMRCLGIPNTRHFHEITKIEDAYALNERLNKESAIEDFKAETMEEFEDEEGNVFNKKTYEDLRRQGII
ncbi:hypothetical protein DFQ28_003927 [Apophysomyces sp. BC1034]|nr:hypothetical protein DFQ30_003937 [Apophysomyces sp. BC1015]KAG0177288.1 hypothetical protein DFQ29_005026 [Apophysomyces sp. BC1021]KAG0189079.1 hypothetical protein DFQ28_003927 [Apophysomyces sp. BC1034]